MQIVIDIPEEVLNLIKKFKVELFCINGYDLIQGIKDGVPLPKGHGAIKDVSQIEIPMCEDKTYEKWVQVAINSAPTIVEADRSEEDG
jgi:hypothetical protein